MVLFSYIIYIDRIAYSPILTDIEIVEQSYTLTQGEDFTYSVKFTKVRPCTVEEIEDSFWHYDNGDNKVFKLSLEVDTSGNGRVLKDIPMEEYPQVVVRNITIPNSWSVGTWGHYSTLEYSNCLDTPFKGRLKVNLPVLSFKVVSSE